MGRPLRHGGASGGKAGVGKPRLEDVRGGMIGRLNTSGRGRLDVNRDGPDARMVKYLDRLGSGRDRVGRLGVPCPDWACPTGVVAEDARAKWRPS